MHTVFEKDEWLYRCSMCGITVRGRDFFESYTYTRTVTDSPRKRSARALCKLDRARNNFRSMLVFTSVELSGLLIFKFSPLWIHMLRIHAPIPLFVFQLFNGVLKLSQSVNPDPGPFLPLFTPHLLCSLLTKFCIDNEPWKRKRGNCTVRCYTANKKILFFHPHRYSTTPFSTRGP